MLKLRILEILEIQGHTKYWLHKQIHQASGMSYQNFKKIVNNETSSIRFDNLELFAKILHVSVGELFTEVPDSNE